MLKLVILTIVIAIILLFLKNVNNDFFVPTLICGGIIILFYAFNYFSEVFTFVNLIIEKSNISKDFYTIIFKIIGIAYIVEFGASTIEEIGFKSLADKLVLTGKIVIFSVSLPIFYALFNLFVNLIK